MSIPSNVWTEIDTTSFEQSIPVAKTSKPLTALKTTGVETPRKPSKPDRPKPSIHHDITAQLDQMGLHSSGQTKSISPAFTKPTEKQKANHSPGTTKRVISALPSERSGLTGPTAMAQFGFDAEEDNDLTFPKGAKIINIVSISAYSLARGF